VADNFSFDKCIDLVRFVQVEDKDADTIEQFWAVLLSLFREKANNKQFYYGKRQGPTF